MAYHLTHLGGWHNVTGSCHLLQINNVNMLIDCGAIQGNDDAVPISSWPVSPSEIRYLFLTHAHLDHVGRIPELLQQGFRGEIMCTHGTKALLHPMLEDAFKFLDISNSQADTFMQTIEDLSWGFEYGRYFDLTSEVRFRLRQSGHILGSSFIRFETDQQAIVFSGDLGARNTPILPDPEVPEPCDLLIMESTYGDHCHESRTERVRRLGALLTRALADKGKVFIPAFAIGRTQELIYELDRLFSDPGWQQQFPALQSPIPVFIDSPLGLKMTTVYVQLSQYWDQEAKELLRNSDHPIDFERLYAIKNYRQHKELRDMSGPAIIIAGSGMCTGGRIISHLKAGLSDPKNDLFFVGYQAYGTPGRDIQQYAQRPDGYVWLDHEKVPIHAQVHTLSGYSAHADQKDLINWVTSMAEKPGKIRLVHGEPEAQNILRYKLIQAGYHVD